MKGVYEKRILLSISTLFILLIFIQHHFVGMCFDDYGYASLSYGWTENTAGMEYTFIELLKFLLWHYWNWGGRILYFFFESLIFRIGGVEWMQAIQSIIVAMIGIVSGKIVALEAKCNPYVSTALVFVMYGTLNIQTLRDGVYWYSASVIYVWPLLPLFGSIYLLLRIRQDGTVFQKSMVVILAFLAAFSQEQTAVLTVIWISGITCCQYFFRRYVPKHMVLMVVSSILGGLLTVLAPGNFIRASDERYADFYSKALIERVSENIRIVLDINVGAYNWVFVVIFTIFCGIAAAIYLKSKSVFTLVFLFIVYFFTEQIYSVPNIIGILVRIAWILFFAAILPIYYYKQQKYLFLFMLIAGISSQGMMVLSPSISTRCHTMMEFILHLIVAESIVNTIKILKNKKKCIFVYQLTIMVTMLYAIGNFCTIIYGYKNNYEMNQINHYKLVEMQKRWKSGRGEHEVFLYKLKDDTYTNCMPYHSGFDFIEIWIKKYYELPEEVAFSWIGIEDDINLRLISGEWYKDHWLGKVAVFVVEAEEERVLKLTVSNLQEKENQQVQCSFAGKEERYDFTVGETKVIELFVPAGRHELTVTPSKTFVPENGDLRELSVLFDLEWKYEG